MELVKGKTGMDNQNQNAAENAVAALFRAALEMADVKKRSYKRGEKERLKGLCNVRAAELVKASLNFDSLCPDDLRERIIGNTPTEAEIVDATELTSGEGPVDVSTNPVGVPTNPVDVPSEATDGATDAGKASEATDTPKAG